MYDPVCVHGQNFKVYSWDGGCVFWEPQGLSSLLMVDDVVTITSPSESKPVTAKHMRTSGSRFDVFRVGVANLNTGSRYCALSKWKTPRV